MDRKKEVTDGEGRGGGLGNCKTHYKEVKIPDLVHFKTYFSKFSGVFKAHESISLPSLSVFQSVSQSTIHSINHLNDSVSHLHFANSFTVRLQ